MMDKRITAMTPSIRKNGGFTLLELVASLSIIGTYFWGFWNLFQILSLSEGTSQGLVTLYVLSAILASINILNYLSKQLRRALSG